jgi:chitin disaccharide deacetylase
MRGWSVKRLIVNADDLGASCGTNRGIVHAHRYGIVTSTSLLVDAPWSDDAAALVATLPSLSVGLHLDLDRVGPTELRRVMEHQLGRFQELLGTTPTHVDTHHDAHRAPRVRTQVRRFAEHHGLPLRGHSMARACSKFYGQWGGETHPEQIDLAGLERLLSAEVRDGVTELSCHPGYTDPELSSSYAEERELEVRTLCDPAIPALLEALDIHLIGFRDLPGRVAGAMV